jgi:putative component of toxin-antitoxin plasmid stabilization module
MIESSLFQKLEESFRLFKQDFNQEDEFKKKLLYYYELALDNIKQNHQEVAILLLCTIIETISIKNTSHVYLDFQNWLVKGDIFDKFLKEIQDEKNKKAVIKKYDEIYLEEFGVTRRFVRTILEVYKKIGGVPEYIAQWKTEVINGVKTTTFRNPEQINEKELWTEFERDIKMIYREYRSKFVHEGKFIPFDSQISTEIGGLSHPKCVTSQQFAGIVLVILKDYFSKDKEIITK